PEMGPQLERLFAQHAASAARTPSGPAEQATRSFAPAGAADQLPTLDAPVATRPRARTARPGDRIADDYEILGTLGKGGMGVVYKARQLSLKREVALKMILGGAHIDANGRARFR